MEILQRWAVKAGVKVGILAEAVGQEFGGFFLSFAVVWVD